MCLSALCAAEMALVSTGARIELGSGVAAAQAHYCETVGRSAPTLRIAAE
jgi:alanine-glyoxylate transaminase / serine-glyoxylate transaminase / serine-pyruvate transaminase